MDHTSSDLNTRLRHLAIASAQTISDVDPVSNDAADDAADDAMTDTSHSAFLVENAELAPPVSEMADANRVMSDRDYDKIFTKSRFQHPSSRHTDGW
jgi:hypothetical protein